MKQVKLGKKFFQQIDIMAKCQNEILEVCNRPSCAGDDLVASARYWEICEIITQYNQKAEKIQ